MYTREKKKEVVAEYSRDSCRIWTEILLAFLTRVRISGLEATRIQPLA